MQPEVTHITTLVELWSRKSAPQSADLQRSLHIARRCATETDSPLWLRSLAWHLVRDSHEAVGWKIPDTDNLSQCRTAAASVRHAYSLLTEEIAGQIDNVDGPVLVLGALGAGRAVLGRWDAIPVSGAVLVPLELESPDLPTATTFTNHHGVMWAGAGRYKKQLQSHCTTATLGGRDVLVPAPEIIMARTRAKDAEPATLGALVFTAAAFQASATGRWAKAEAVAQTMDAEAFPTELAIRLGIAQWLGLKIPAGKRLAMAIKLVFRRSGA